MGEIAEMMLDGTLCEGCGVANTGESYGVPWRCGSCKREARGDGGGAKKPGKAERERAKAKRGDPLPAWKLESAE